METSDTRFKGFPNADNVCLSETIIVADADYLDDVAFRFTVQGERILGRRVPKADLSQWAVDAALDGGLRADGKSHTTQVLLVHEKANSQLRNFSPSVYATGSTPRPLQIPISASSSSTMWLWVTWWARTITFLMWSGWCSVTVRCAG